MPPKKVVQKKPEKAPAPKKAQKGGNAHVSFNEKYNLYKFDPSLPIHLSVVGKKVLEKVQFNGCGIVFAKSPAANKAK